MQRGTAHRASESSASRSPARPAPPTTTRTPGSSASRPTSRSASSSATTSRSRSATGHGRRSFAAPIFREFMKVALKDKPRDAVPRAARHRADPRSIRTTGMRAGAARAADPRGLQAGHGAARQLFDHRRRPMRFGARSPAGERGRGRRHRRSGRTSRHLVDLAELYLTMAAACGRRLALQARAVAYARASAIA